MAEAETVVALNRLLGLTDALQRGRRLDDFLAVLLRQAVDLDGVDAACILLTDASGDSLTLQVSEGFPDIPQGIPIGHGLAGRVAEARAAVIVDELDEFPTYGPALRKAGLHSAVGVPLITREELLGVILIGSRTRRAFGQRMVPILGGIAEHVALTVEAIRAEQALLASGSRFRALFEHAPMGIAFIDLRPASVGELLLVNEAFSRTTGLSLEQLQGMVGSDLLVPADREAARAAVAELMAEKTSGYVAERRAIRADGSPIWLRASVSTIRDHDEAPYAIVFLEDITARRSAENELARQALTDPLTGLANRQLATDHLRLALRQQRRFGGAVGVLYVDLDHFKQINDTYGHGVGDEVLQSVAMRLKDAVRAVDSPARLGGDEFLVVCPQLRDGEEIALVAGRLLRSLDKVLSLPGIPPLRIGASIGVAVGDRELSPEELIRQADIALYQAKRDGRHQWLAYSPELDQAVQKRRSAEGLLAEAVDNGWFQLVFQPVVELSSRRPVGAEVLLRMAHPQHGLLTPATFIDVLETSDLGQGIERWVLEEACRSLQEWPDGLLPGLSINVSGRLAASGALARTVMTAADAAGIDPARLTIELTERVLVQAGTAVVGDLDALTGQGVRLAIDDFGTGYSSLTYLQQFPISTIKIDRSFVAGLGNRPRDDAIVAAVCALGAALNLAVVAEGIEDERQVEALRGAGCRHGQGYLFGKPAQRDAFSAWLGGAATAT